MIVARNGRVTSLCTPEATGIHSIASTVALSLLRERDRLRLTQIELARRTGISRSRISEIEAGREGGRGLMLVTFMILTRGVESTPNDMLGFHLPGSVLPASLLPAGFSGSR